MKLASMLDIEPIHYEEEGREARGYLLFAKPADGVPGPQAHYGEWLEPGLAVRTHFHEVDQFQIFLEGDGRFGSAEITPIMIQYADAYTPYGPIIGGTIGARYVTLRIAPSEGQFHIPERRADRKRLDGRQTHVHYEPGSPDPSGSATWHLVLGPLERGTAAYAVELAPGATIDALPGDLGVAQHYVVARGSLARDGREHPQVSTMYVESGDERPVFEAGHDGLCLLGLVFPPPFT